MSVNLTEDEIVADEKGMGTREQGDLGTNEVQIVLGTGDEIGEKKEMAAEGNYLFIYLFGFEEMF